MERYLKYQVRAPKIDHTKGKDSYSKALEYEYRVKTDVLGTLKRYSIFSLTLYIAWCSMYSIHRGGPTAGQQRARAAEAALEWAVAGPTG
jgi:hypothetical protein